MIDLNLKKVPSNVLLSKDARHDTASSKSTEWSTKLWTSSTCVNTHKSVKKSFLYISLFNCACHFGISTFLHTTHMSWLEEIMLPLLGIKPAPLTW